MKKTFIFDFDGTLSESILFMFEAMRNAYKRLGLKPPTDAEISAHFGCNEYGMLRNISPDRIDDIFPLYLEEYEALHGQSILFDGIIDIVRRIKDSGAIVGLVTGKHKATAEISLRLYGIADLFDEVRCGEPQGSVKTEKISDILKVRNIAPENAWYLGDTVLDIKDAKAAGVHMLSVAWSDIVNPEKLRAENPDEVFEKVSDFSDWLKKMGI